MSLCRADRVVPPLTRRRAERLFTPRDADSAWADDTGAATAEYAIATMATLARLRQNFRTARLSGTRFDEGSFSLLESANLRAFRLSSDFRFAP
jgi:hypothetical protein